LDESNAPLEIGSHLDLAAARLDHVLHGKASPGTIDQLEEELERLAAWSDADVGESA
jgi:hypothetical protein